MARNRVRRLLAPGGHAGIRGRRVTGKGYDGTAEELYASAAPVLKRGYAYSSMSVTMVAPAPGVRGTCT
jgi:hypothetical protein